MCVQAFYMRVHVLGSSRNSLLTLLVARPCSSASKMWRGRHPLPELSPCFLNSSGSLDPRRGPLPNPIDVNPSPLMQDAESRQSTPLMQDAESRQSSETTCSYFWVKIKLLKGLSHEIETGQKLCCWIDLSQERSRWWFLKFLKAPSNFKKC